MSQFGMKKRVDLSGKVWDDGAGDSGVSEPEAYKTMRGDNDSARGKGRIPYWESGGLTENQRELAHESGRMWYGRSDKQAAALDRGPEADEALAELRRSNGLPAGGPRFDNRTSKGFEEPREQTENRKRITAANAEKYKDWKRSPDGIAAQDDAKVGELIRKGMNGMEARRKVREERRRSREASNGNRSEAGIASAVRAASNALGVANSAKGMLTAPITDAGEAIKGVGRRLGIGQGEQKQGALGMVKGKDRRTGQTVYYLDDGRILDQNGKLVGK